MNILDFELKNSETIIKVYKRCVIWYHLLTWGILSIVLYDSFSIYLQEDKSLFLVACTSILAAQFYSCLLQLIDSKKDLKLEQKRLSRMKKLKDNELYNRMQDQIKNSQSFYSNIIKEYDINKKMVNDFYHENKQQESTSPEMEKL